MSINHSEPHQNFKVFIVIISGKTRCKFLIDIFLNKQDSIIERRDGS